MKIAITGASGFLGRALSTDLQSAGHEIVGFVREPDEPSRVVDGVRAAACRLPDVLDESALEGASVIVHAAWATTETDATRAAAANEEGTRRVVAAAHRAGARVVFVSSIAARPDAPSRYGRSKWAMEQCLDLDRDAVLRPGLVIGPGAGGLFAQLSTAARRVHVVPVFSGGRQPLQTVHVDDVALAIRRIVERDLAGTFVVAEPEPIALRDFLSLMVAEMRVRCAFVSLPLGPVMGAVRIAERLGLPLPLRSESLLGMQGMRRVDVDDSLRRLGMSVAPAARTIKRCGLETR